MEHSNGARCFAPRHRTLGQPHVHTWLQLFPKLVDEVIPREPWRHRHVGALSSLRIRIVDEEGVCTQQLHLLHEIIYTLETRDLGSRLGLARGAVVLTRKSWPCTNSFFFLV